MAVVEDAARVGGVRPEDLPRVGVEADHLHRVVAVAVGGLRMHERLPAERVIGRAGARNHAACDRRGQEHPAAGDDGRGVAATFDRGLPEQVAFDCEVGRRAGAGTCDAAAVGAAKAGPVVGGCFRGEGGRRRKCGGDQNGCW